MDSSVAVVVPCFNQGRYLDEALASVREQARAAAEIVVVDDGSSDETPQIAARHADVRYVRQAHRGLAHARNRGVDETRSPFVTFLDADDRLRPNAIAAGARALAARPDCAFVFGDCVRIDEEGHPLPTVPPRAVDGDHYTALLGGNFIWTPAVVMFRRVRCGPLLRFNAAVDASADYELYLRLTRRFPAWGHGELVAEYRRHRDSMSRDAARMLASTLTVLRAERRSLRDERERRAWQAGLRTWQTHYGEQVLEDARRDLAEGRWPLVARDLAVLARYYPAGLMGSAARRFGRLFAVTGGQRV